jgi:hypothetical protein
MAVRDLKLDADGVFSVPTLGCDSSPLDMAAYSLKSRVLAQDRREARLGSGLVVQADPRAAFPVESALVEVIQIGRHT